jgi:hypothetical protein
MNGAELATEARQRFPGIRIVITSGYVGGPPVPNAAFVPKPFRPSDIAQVVSKTLDQNGDGGGKRPPPRD